MNAKAQRARESIPEPIRFIVEFETPEIRRRGVDAAADIKGKSVFLRKDGSAVIDREQLERLKVLDIPFRIKSMPPQYTTKNPEGELRK